MRIVGSDSPETWDGHAAKDEIRLAERATLGAMILDQYAATDVIAILTGADFSDPRHEHVWNAVTTLRAIGDTVDAVTVAKALADAGKLAAIGGGDYLHTLIATPPAPASGSHYAKIVKRASLSRQLTDLASGITQRAADLDPLKVIADTQNKLAGLLNTTAADSLVRFGSIAAQACDSIEQAAAAQSSDFAATGLPSGFNDLDRLLHGLGAGKLIIVAALSGGGKSVLLGDFYRTWTKHKIPCCMVTLEMGHEEVWRRQAAAACRIDHDRIQSGSLDDNDWSRLARWIGDTDDAPTWICDKPSMTLAELDALACRGAERYGWRGLVVDYAQKIKHRASTREREVAEIAAGLKEIARKTGMAVIAGAQLNREAAKRGAGVPKLSDMRESASLEHESDVALLIHRPDYEDKESPRAGEADFIIAKHRGGKSATVTVAAQLHFQRFVSIELPPDTRNH